MSATVYVRYGDGKLAEVPKDLGDVLKSLQGQRFLLLAELKRAHSCPFEEFGKGPCSACALIARIEGTR